ncbi:SDR family oxidoreductase [Nocardioides eburneiflavus]|uniref:SDR family oxidoreductase n=1 Tax=Nocardioides eburneiflavus TaxID=2518372 RepID=A0A4Z1C6R0_9ACTN|nr:SDR family oxidoreductase [Nocardioides eburneiflavus]TGN65062.1 SDR family oxidoreductase [Nocardioides eburneiflavus]
MPTNAESSAADLFDMAGKRALVTGASRGIGRAIALEFAARGAVVSAMARTNSDLVETCTRASEMPGSISPVVADLGNPDAIRDGVSQATAELGGLDILVNNAGYDNEQTVQRTTLDEWQRVMDLNLRAVLLLCQEAGPQLLDGGGKVVNVASMFGLVAVRGEAAYTASKHAVIGLTKALALEWARKGVQVNALCPGFVETDMLASATAVEEAAAYMRKATPVGRWAQVEDMTGPAVFLATAASNFMTGQTLVVDGGYTAQ